MHTYISCIVVAVLFFSLHKLSNISSQASKEKTMLFCPLILAPVWKRCRALLPQRPEYFCVFSSATAHYHVSERIRWCVLYVSSAHEFIFINELNWVQLRCKTGWSSIRGLRVFKQRVQQILKGHWAKDCPCSFQIKSFMCYVDVAYIVNNAKLLPQST